MRDSLMIGSLNRLILSIGIACLSGCAAITNPVANGVPAHLLPDELLAESQEAFEQVPLAWLRVNPPKPYRLDTGDIIGVYIDGVLGDRTQPPPINFPQVADIPPSIGFPIPIGEDGTVLFLPFVDKVKVAGMTVEEAREAIADAYTVGAQQILKAEKAQVLVTLVRARQARILVIREDAPYTRPSLNDPTYRLFGSAPSLGQRSQGSGQILELPETEADVLSALARTGGLPGPTAASEVIIYRGINGPDGYDLPADWQGASPNTDGSEPHTVRIPLRIRPGEKRPFDSKDIRLESGDIVFVPPRETDVYYTGGLLPAREVPLPRDNDIRVVGAILRIGGSVVSGGTLVGSFSQSTSLVTGVDRSSPSLLTVLRRMPNGGFVNIRVDLNRALRDPRENLLVQPGDVLLLQETPGEAVSRYLTNVLNVGLVGRYLNRQDATGTATLRFP